MNNRLEYLYKVFCYRFRLLCYRKRIIDSTSFLFIVHDSKMNIEFYLVCMYIIIIIILKVLHNISTLHFKHFQSDKTI